MNRQMALWWGGVSVALIALSPLAPRLADGLWSCLFKSLTGLACPTCGTGRAALALARLDVVEALARYPLPTLGWIVVIGGGLVSLGMALLGRTPPAISTRLPIWARVSALAALVLNWAYSIATGV